MKRDSDQPPEGLGLLACGSSRLWSVDVDESFDGDSWWMDLDGPQTYLVFQLRDLQVVPKALLFLRASLHPHRTDTPRKWSEAEDALPLGRFGSASVSLLRDNEDVPRCFIVVGGKARSTLRLSLDAADMQMLIDALQQVLDDLPREVRCD
jgi:hypothetical protein